MFSVYIIESGATSSWYYGFTARNPVERIIEHNGNHHHFTAQPIKASLFSVQLNSPKKLASSPISSVFGVGSNTTDLYAFEVYPCKKFLSSSGAIYFGRRHVPSKRHIYFLLLCSKFIGISSICFNPRVA